MKFRNLDQIKLQLELSKSKINTLKPLLKLHSKQFLPHENKFFHAQLKCH